MVSKYDKVKIRNRLQDLEEIGFSEQNLKDLKSFTRDYQLDEKSEATPLAILDCFKRIAPLIDFDLRDASKRQVEDLVLAINAGEHEGVEWRKESYSPHTLADDRSAIQTFYSWYLDEESPDICDFIRCKAKKSELDPPNPEELLQVSEAEKIIDACMNPRDRCMLGLLWDSGMRVKEIMALEWRDIRIDQDAMMHVHVREGKNGGRHIHLYESVPLITAWLDEYPGGAPDPEDPLWIDLRWPEKKSKVGKRAVAKQIKEARERVSDEIPDIRRSCPKFWRKARATDMAKKGMNLPAANKMFGWVRESIVFKKYIWLAEVDLENTMRKMYGLEPIEQNQKFIGENLPEYQDVEMPKKQMMAAET